MKFRSLRFRINAAILSACIIVAVFFAAIFIPFEINSRQSRMNEIQVLMSVVFQQKKEELANEIFANQHIALVNTLREMQKVKDISGVSIFGRDGEIIHATDESVFSPLNQEEIKMLDISPGFSKITAGGTQIVQYSSVIEVIGEKVGFIKMYFDLKDMEYKSLVTGLIFSALLLFTLGIMAFFLNLLLTRSIIKPTSILRDAIMRLQAGRLGEKVDLDSRDEIGEMALAFNSMSERLMQQHEELLKLIEARNTYAGNLEESNRALEHLNANLENMVEDRTKELKQSYEHLQQEINEHKRADDARKVLEERLARSQKMEAVGLLAGGVAHDLNNVLSGTVSYPDLLLMELPQKSPLRKPIETIRESGQKAAAIVQDLLTLARRGVTQTSVLNMNNDVIKEYLLSPEQAKIALSYPKVMIETCLDDNLLNIRGSAVHLKKTFMNLIINAVEAQPDGGKITITTENRYVDTPIQGYDDVKEGDYIVLMVSDNGVGIAQEDFKRIFEPFYTSKVMGRSGTGLGMAVVWGTVQDHDGYINVHSIMNDGTTFELYFPATQEEVSQQKTSIPVVEYMGNKEKILVVDDLEEQREIALNILQRLNYSPTAVSSGEEAVEYLKQNSADILLLDMIMSPGMDGLETYRKIIEFYPGQRAIIASGYAESERVKDAQRLGVGHYIRKPYTIEKIGIAIRDQLNR
ncbi:MAG: response regulator [Deltaproteobacteria bacterium]|nr:response regulator [Deltaproteobacteria bacterium]